MACRGVSLALRALSGAGPSRANLARQLDRASTHGFQATRRWQSSAIPGTEGEASSSASLESGVSEPAMPSASTSTTAEERINVLADPPEAKSLPKKRGRKSKAELAEIEAAKAAALDSTDTTASPDFAVETETGSQESVETGELAVEKSSSILPEELTKGPPPEPAEAPTSAELDDTMLDQLEGMQESVTPPESSESLRPQSNAPNEEVDISAAVAESLEASVEPTARTEAAAARQPRSETEKVSPVATLAQVSTAGPKGDKPAAKLELFVAKLPNGTTDAKLTAFFSKIGPLVHCNVVKRKDGSLRNCGFVKFQRNSDAEKVIAQSNQIELDGEALYINKAAGPPRFKKPVEGAPPYRVVYLGNVPYDMKEQELGDLVPQAERIRMPILPGGRGRGFAYIYFKDKEQAGSFVNDAHANGYYLHGRNIRVGYAAAIFDR